MRHSFRVRLAVFSVGICGCVLAAFALSAWGLGYRLGLRQIDREMAESAGPILLVPHGPRQWPWIAGGLRLRFGAEGKHGCLLLVADNDGKVLLQSGSWPQALRPDTILASVPADPRLRLLPRPRSPQAASGGDAAPPARKADAGALPPWHFLRMSPPLISTRRVEGCSWRLYVQRNEEVTFVLGVSLSRLQAEMTRATQSLTAALPVALALIALGSWLTSGRALRSVETLATVTEQVTAASLDQRIPPESVEKEFRRLIAVYNGMLDRLERSFNQAVRFGADAAHEFRTPLTILQGQIERALRRTPEDSLQQETYSELLAEVLRLKSIVQKLLLLSQADAGQLQLVMERTSLSTLVEEAAEDVQALAPGLDVTACVPPELYVTVDAELLAAGDCEPHQQCGEVQP